MLGDFRRPYLRSVVYTASRGIIGGITGLVALSVQDVASSELGAIVVATLAGAVTAQVLDIAFACFTVWLRGTTRPWDTARTIAPVAFSAVPLYAPVVVLLTIAYQELSPWTLVLFFVPALAAQRLFALLQAQRQLTEGLSAANRQLERANLSFASALVATLDARDQYTAGHSAAVAVYSRDIAARMGLTADDQQSVHLAGLVHDIGKIGLPPGLLEKEGPFRWKNVGSCRVTRRSGSESLRTSMATTTSHRWCDIIMNGSMGTAIQTASWPTTSRFCRASSRSRRIQRDDVRQTVSRGHAEPRRANAPCPSRRRAVRYKRSSGIRGHIGHCRRVVSLRHERRVRLLGEGGTPDFDLHAAAEVA